MSQLNSQDHYCSSDDEVSLLDLLEILWKKKRLILGVTALAALLSIGVVLSMKRTWESTTGVLVLTPSGEGAPQLSSEALQQIASSSELLAQLLQKVPQSPDGSPSPSEYRRNNFVAKVSETGAPKRDDILSAPVHFTLSFKASSPEVALQSATQWTSLFDEQLRKVYVSVGRNTVAKFEADYNAARLAQEELERALQELVKTSPAEQMERTLSELEDRYHTMQQQLTEVSLELDGTSAQLPPLEEALATLPAQSQHQGARSNIEVSTTAPLDQTLKGQIIQLKVQQALKTSQKKWLHEELGKIELSTNQLRLDLQKASLEQGRLQGDLEIQRTRAQRLYSEFQNTQRFASENSFGSLVQVIVSPELPTKPIAPARGRMVILATLAGAFLGVLGAFLSHAIDERRRKNA